MKEKFTFAVGLINLEFTFKAFEDVSKANDWTNIKGLIEVADIANPDKVLFTIEAFNNFHGFWWITDDMKSQCIKALKEHVSFLNDDDFNEGRLMDFNEFMQSVYAFLDEAWEDYEP